MFRSINIHNFLSWERLDYSFKEGITLLTGMNYDDGRPEAAGKSSILNALCWCLYGKIPKDEYTVDTLVKEGAKSCKVKVKLENGMSIVRCRNPNTVYILENDNSAPLKLKDMKETQQAIDKLLGISYETFLQTVYLPQNYSKKFISATSSQKAKILSEVQNLSAFDDARKEVLEWINSIESEVKYLGTKIEENKNSINRNEKYLKNFKSLKETFNYDKQKELSQLEKDLHIAQAKLQEVNNKAINLSRSQQLDFDESELDHLIKLEDKIRTKLEEKQQERTKRLELKKELERITEESNLLTRELSYDSCYACGSYLEGSTKDKYIKDIENKLTQFNFRANEIEDYLGSIFVDDIDNSKAELERILKKKSELHKNKDAVKDNKFLIEKYKSESNSELDKIEKIKSTIKSVREKSSTDIDSSILELEKELAVLKETRIDFRNSLTSFKDDLSRLYILKDLFKDIKSYVFNGFLEQLTAKSNEYAAELFNQDVKINFTSINEDGEAGKIQVDVELGGSSRPLGLYSGGQFKRLQLAVDLALSNLITHRTGNPIKFRALDEYFTSLSEVSMEQILRLLEDQEGVTILVEHNSIFKSIVNNTVSIEYRNGVSRLAA